MRIGLNLLYLIPGVVGGTETYAAGLLEGLARVDRDDEFIVFVNRESAEWSFPEVSNFTRVVCPIWAADRKRRYLFELVSLPKWLRAYRVDVVHSLGYIGPLFATGPSVVTVPDLNYRSLGMYMSFVRKMALGFFVHQSVCRATRVLTISQFSKREIVQAFGLPSERVIVTHLAPKSDHRITRDKSQALATLTRLRIDAPYILAFSSRGPNKNIGRLLEVFSRLKAQDCLPHQLVLAGHLSPNDTLFLSTKDEVRATGYLDDDTLFVVLSNAQIMVFPSFYEGFGLPVLEAMACGVPVACSKIDPLLEVAGEAALFFDPFSLEDMAQTIRNMVTDPVLRTDLTQKGYRNLQRFSWEETAQLTLAAYRDAAATK